MPPSGPRRSVLWFRRDLRLHDNPALLSAADGVDEVVPLFVVDPALWQPAGAARPAYLVRSLRALDASLDDALVLRHGDPRRCVAEVAREAGASSVHVAADFGPYGAVRDIAVEAALAADGVELVRTGSAYAVDPGRVRKSDGSPYRVYSAFYRGWLRHGWAAPAASGGVGVPWSRPIPCDGYPPEPEVAATLPPAGEHAALERWQRFLADGLDRYDVDRDRPDVDGSSRLSVHLKLGELHPRTLLSEVGDSRSHETFRRELAWREFHADVLHHDPASARDYLRTEFADLEYDDPASSANRLHAWQQGRTGYPFVDAGMRQLLAEGWMHNRVRMVVASFLVKDLHLEWQLGARWFMRHLVDGDLASNSHG